MKDITGREYIYGIAQNKNGAPYLFNIGELVRCKDCRHGQYDATHYFCAEHHHKVYEDDYCSYGERREP